ncbi:MAG: hypothetical protein WBA29_02755 [Xanthobacteraceae bacterium]
MVFSGQIILGWFFSGLKMKFFKDFAGLLSVGVFSTIMLQPAAAQSSSDVTQEIINGVVQGIVQNVRDEVRRRGVAQPSGGALRFNGEAYDLDGRDLFAEQRISDPFGALGYAKAPGFVAATPAWLYGGNLVGSADRASAALVKTNVETVMGAFDVTRIGVFTGTDALTFIGTGGHSWSRATTPSIPPFPGFALDSSVPSASATVSYLNGSFSADASILASWSRATSNLVGPGAVTDSTSLAYTFNTQYRFDWPYAVWFEPTVGVTYSESYSANFGLKTGDSTEVHGGVRMGTEMKWMGYKVQPTVSAVAFGIVDSSAGVTDVYGIRGSAKMNVLWSQNFSSYLEVHGTAMSQEVAFVAPGFSPGVGVQTIGVQAGLRYTWN